MNATNCWPDCDVLITLGGTPLLLYQPPQELNHYTHGIITEGSINLSIEEARALAQRLLQAATAAEQLQKDWELQEFNLHCPRSGES